MRPDSEVPDIWIPDMRGTATQRMMMTCFEFIIIDIGNIKSTQKRG